MTPRWKRIWGRFLLGLAVGVIGYRTGLSVGDSGWIAAVVVLGVVWATEPGRAE